MLAWLTTEEEEGEFWEDLHAGLASLVLVAVHVFGVLVSCFLHRENLVKAMLTGDKPGRNVNV